MPIEGGSSGPSLRAVHHRRRDLAIWVETDDSAPYLPDDPPTWRGAATVAAVRAAWGIPWPGDVR